MEGRLILLYMAGFIAILGAIIVILKVRAEERKMISRLSKMLDSAIDGSFTETLYDESALSALEVKLNRHLSQGFLSSKKLIQERDKIKSLVADISHQTKIPVSNIVLYSSLLSEDHNLSAENRSMAEQICIQSQKLHFLIDALIKASRLETGIISLSPAKNSLKELIEAALRQIEQKAQNKEIMIVKEISEDWAVFDLKWTAEAVCNLLDNAVKYSPESGRINIKTTAYELFSRIDISDNGIGIAEEEQSRIFTRFYRSRKVQQIEGIGLGLFLAREIISGQGGYMKVSSGPGQGSTFSIFLPRGN